MPVKGRLTTGSKQTANSKPKDAGNLSDLLIPMGNKRVYVNYKGTDYAIEDVIKASGQVILLAEEDGKAIKANWLAEELKNATGLGVYLEIEGKLVPAQDVINSKIQAKKATAIEENEDSVTSSNEFSSSNNDSIITLITMVLDSGRGTEKLLSQMVGSLTDQEVIVINNHLSRQPKLTKSQQSLLFTIKAEIGKRNITASKGKVNYNPHKGDSYSTYETEAADSGNAVKAEKAGPFTFNKTKDGKLEVYVDGSNYKEIGVGTNDTFLMGVFDKKQLIGLGNGTKDKPFIYEHPEFGKIIVERGRAVVDFYKNEATTDNRWFFVHRFWSEYVNMFKKELARTDSVTKPKPYTSAADFVKPVFTDKDYEDFDAQVKSRFRVSAEVAEAGKDTLSITFEPIRGGVDLENPKFQSQLEEFIKFTFGGEFKKAVTDIDTVEEDYLVILVDYSKVKVLKAFDDSDLETEAAPKVTPMLKKDYPELLKKTKAQLLVKKAMSIFSHNK